MNEYGKDCGNPSVKVYIVWRTDLHIGCRLIVEMFTSKINAEAFAFRQWTSEKNHSNCRYEVEEHIALSH